MFAGNASVWIENKDRGDNATPELRGKRFYLDAEPQFWYRLSGGLFMGTKLNAYDHLNTADIILEPYPTIAIKIKL